MTCVVCQNPEQPVDRGQTCDDCAAGILRDLDRIPELYAQLSTVPVVRPGGVYVTGSHEAPLPLRVDALDLTMPARAGTVRDPYGDQVGHVPVASELDQWVDDWREHRGKGERRPEPPTVTVLASWLAKRLADACADHPAIDEFAADMHRIVNTLRAATGDTPSPPQRLPTPCSYCDQLTLVRVPARDVRPICCRACGRSWSEEEYAEWAGELAHAVSVPAAA